jgi:pimeloyl-ACP methyl ester carboxylesterase
MPNTPDRPQRHYPRPMPFVLADGTRLYYDDVGAGEPPLVFLHPWSGDRTFFAAQVNQLSATHRCVAVDLRGHGESDAPTAGYSMPNLADDVAAVMTHLDLVPAVVIGHSMGGVVAGHHAARHAERVVGVVDLDSPILPPAGFAGLVPPLLEGMRSEAFREVTRTFQGQFVGFAHDLARREEILDALVRGAQHVKVATLEHVFGDDHEDALRRSTVPLLYVGSGGGFTDVERLRVVCPRIVIRQVSASGHFVPLEVPDQVNTMIEEFVARLT